MYFIRCQAGKLWLAVTGPSLVTHSHHAALPYPMFMTVVTLLAGHIVRTINLRIFEADLMLWRYLCASPYERSMENEKRKKIEDWWRGLMLYWIGKTRDSNGVNEKVVRRGQHTHTHSWPLGLFGKHSSSVLPARPREWRELVVFVSGARTCSAGE